MSQTTTIISDSFALFGEKIVGPPDRPDMSQQEFDARTKADRIRQSQVLREYVSNIEEAAVYGFPKPVSHTLSGWMVIQREPIYSRKQILVWRERFMTDA